MGKETETIPPFENIVPFNLMKTFIILEHKNLTQVLVTLAPLKDRSRLKPQQTHMNHKITHPKPDERVLLFSSPPMKDYVAPSIAACATEEAIAFKWLRLVSKRGCCCLSCVSR